MDQKAKGIVDPLLYADEGMESVEAHRWPPKAFDFFIKTRETPTGPVVVAAARAAGAAAESGHHQITAAGLPFQGCTEQEAQGGFQAKVWRAPLSPLSFTENMANRVSSNRRVHDKTHRFAHVGAQLFISATGISWIVQYGASPAEPTQPPPAPPPTAAAAAAAAATNAGLTFP